MKRSFFAICTLLIFATTYAQTVTYTLSDKNIRNPERGLYYMNSNYDGFTDGLIQYYCSQQDTMSLVFRIYLLNDFQNSAISEPFLNAIRTDFATMKRNGVKCILRFAYNNENLGGNADASKAIILQHINQLKPILQENSDLIFTVQAGFIGYRGEWRTAYMGNFGSSSNPEMNIAANQQEMVDTLLNALPKNRTIQLPAPGIKQTLYQPNPLTDAQGFDESDMARVGFHNDYFLYLETDQNTYSDKAQQMLYMQQETKYVPMCGHLFDNWENPSLNCTNALGEMETLHFSSLDGRTYEGALNQLKSDGCFNEIKNRLGYRFSLLSGTYPATALPGNDFSVDIELENSGFASLVNPRPVYLIFENTEYKNVAYKIPLNIDPRSWQPGQHTLSETVSLPSTMEAGNYKLALFLPDESERLAGNPLYSIRFANENTWNATTGYNDLLHLVTIADNEVVSNTYTVSTDDIKNPERGIYDQLNSPSSVTWALPDSDWKINQLLANNISIILRMYVLDAFQNSPISDSYLNFIRSDFAYMQQKGIKCVLRFVYNNANANEETADPNDTYGGGRDASKTIVMQHIAQLKPVLMENADLIFAVQAGFIGDCGEWHSSTNAADWNNLNNRRELVDALLDALPPSRMVQLRTPGQKQTMYQSDALTDNQGFNESNIARIGFHNDCFLSSWNDVGTYSDTLSQRIYMNQETKYVPTGGEMCILYEDKMNCGYGIREMELLHWSYLVPFDWTGQFNDCEAEIKKRLGYRFSLLAGTYPETVVQGGNFSFNIKLKNTGFAPLINPRTAYLVFRNIDNPALEYTFALNTDPRSWLPGLHRLSETITIPREMQNGRYRLFLSLPDQSERLAANSAYSVRMANNNIWETTTGYNDLDFEITVLQNIALSTKTIIDNDNIKIYPNPVNDYLYIDFDKNTAYANTTIQILNAANSSILTKNINNSHSKLNIANLPTGVYILKIMEGNKIIKNYKFIKK